MFTLFIVFQSGHNIEIERFEFLENALATAKYHEYYTKDEFCHFEVVQNGEVLFTTHH